MSYTVAEVFARSLDPTPVHFTANVVPQVTFDDQDDYYGHIHDIDGEMIIMSIIMNADL